MSILKSLIVAAGVAAAAGAMAGTERLTDSQYLAAARCEGLYNSPALGKVDAAAIDKVMKSESAYRDPAILDRGESVRDAAKHEARSASPTTRTALTAERDGACQTYASIGVGNQAAK
jgi:hypothetical protein